MRSVLFTIILVPVAVHAQSEVSISAFAATNGAFPGSPGLYGLSIGNHGKIFGLRAGGSLGRVLQAPATGAVSESHPAGWTADADLLFEPARAIPEIASAFGGFEPSLFTGAGLAGSREASTNGMSDWSYVPMWSYGGRLARSLGNVVSLESEARYRKPMDIGANTASAPGVITSGWEYRVGLGFRFGGGGPRPSRTPARWPAAGVPVVIPTGGRGGPAPRTSATASAVLSTADDYLGTRYVYGGTTPSGFDCSGFIQYVFRRHGVTLPRTSRQMATAGDRVAPRLRELRAGDLVMFAQSTTIDHVAIYAGGNRIIHSTSSGGGVRYDDLSSPRGQWFVKRMVAARRVISDGQSLVRALDAAAVTAARLDPPDLAPKP